MHRSSRLKAHLMTQFKFDFQELFNMLRFGQGFLLKCKIKIIVQCNLSTTVKCMLLQKKKSVNNYFRNAWNLMIATLFLFISQTLTLSPSLVLFLFRSFRIQLCFAIMKTRLCSVGHYFSILSHKRIFCFLLLFAVKPYYPY